MVGCANDKGAEAAWCELQEMDGDDPPGALDEELLEEGHCSNSWSVDMGIRVQERASGKTGDDDGEPPAQHLAAIPCDGTAKNSTGIGNDLCHSDFVGREAMLAGQHGRIEVLRSVGLYIYICG